VPQINLTLHHYSMQNFYISITDEFYSLFYLGLYCEIRGESSKAETYMKAAVASKYAVGPGAGDYMTSCARVHCKLRGWA
jgi:hypothetical protein